LNAVGQAPAHQRFDQLDAAYLEIHFGLEHQFQFLAGRTMLRTVVMDIAKSSTSTTVLVAATITRASGEK